jgi:Xaa-Pro aminopeptidase
MPFSAEVFTRRMERAAAQAAAAGLTGVLAAPGPDLLYLSGYSPVAITERLTLLVVQEGREPAMVLPTLERPDAEAAPGAGAIALTDWSDGSDPYAAAAPLLDPRGRYAISDSAWALQLLGLMEASAGTRFASMTSALPMLRAVKDAEEVERLAAAGAAVDACLAELLGMRFSGRSEAEVAAELKDLMTAHGHSQIDFAAVGSGPNGANPHHGAGPRTIEEGDMVVLDFGGIKDGYGSDISRTVHVGEPTAEEREVHEIVRRAQQAGYEAARPGAACQDVDRAARAVIAGAGHGERFIHRTGHGIGVTTHEPPYIVEGEEQPLEPGMCFSIEPGIYLPGRFGVRIEDIVTVTDGGAARRFTEAPRELQLVA